MADDKKQEFILRTTRKSYGTLIELSSQHQSMDIIQPKHDPRRIGTSMWLFWIGGDKSNRGRYGKYEGRRN